MRNKVNSTLILCLLLSLACASCSNLSQENRSKGLSGSTTVSTSLTAQTDGFIDQKMVRWITVRGGLKLRTKVLFQENEPEKIQRIIEMVNSGVNERTSTENEIWTLQGRTRPNVILIGLQSGETAFIGPVYRITRFKDGTSYTPFDDRFIINFQRGNVMGYQRGNRYITVFSKEVAQYLRGNWEKDMPRVNDVTINRQKLKATDIVTISGDGCIEKEVKIYLKQPSGKKSYLVGRVVPKLGRWKWHSIIQKEFVTVDGKHVTVSPGDYFFNISIGEESIGTGQVSIQ